MKFQIRVAPHSALSLQRRWTTIIRSKRKILEYTFPCVVSAWEETRLGESIITQIEQRFKRFTRLLVCGYDKLSFSVSWVLLNLS